MNENIRLEEEELLFIGNNPSTRIKYLNEIGIFTVADYINADVTTLLESKANGPMKELFVIYQQILSYKYRGQKMVRDVYLDREYHLVKNDGDAWGILTSAPKNAKSKEISSGRIDHNLCELGFLRFFQGRRDFSFLQTEHISMIDAIKKIAELDSKFKPLSDFYVEYYEKEIKKSETEELDVQNVTALKNEIVRLLSQRNKLDSKIAQLVEQVNALEGGSITNARK